MVSKGRPAPLTNYADVNEHFLYCAASASQQVAVTVKSKLLTVSRIYVNGAAKTYPNMNNNEYIKLRGKVIHFEMLQNGFTTEAHLNVGRASVP